MNQERIGTRDAIPGPMRRAGRADNRRMMPMPRSFLAAALLAGLALLTACGGGGDTQEPPVTPQPPATWSAARQRWIAAEPVGYRYTLARICFCPPESPVTVTVRRGAITEAVESDTGTPLAAERRAALPTITGLYDLGDDAWRRGAASVQFEADATHGHLVSLWIDQDAQMVDEELGYRVSDYAVEVVR